MIKGTETRLKAPIINIFHLTSVKGVTSKEPSENYHLLLQFPSALRSVFYSILDHCFGFWAHNSDELFSSKILLITHCILLA